MGLAPLLTSSPIIQIHTFAAFASVTLLAPIAAMPKGTTAHRRIGWLWVVSMLVVGISSFGIGRSGAYSWIHILSVVSLVSLSMGVIQRRRGDIRSHKAFMIGAASGLAVAGLFTMLPGRVMHAVLFV